VIISRKAELRRLDDLLTALIRGEGSALIVHGDAGIGKTTLLEALAEHSGDAVTVVRACGAETEMELPFSALADLLGPVLGHMDALPVPQAAVLMGALALEPPTPGDRLAVCVAALGVLRAAARSRPVLAIVDDVQWVDASSCECIEYVARRADGPLAVVLAARDPLYPPERVRLPELAVGPVDDAAAAELLRHRVPGLAPPVVAAITHAAAGNPLALVELPATLTAGQRAGVAALELPLAPGGRLQRAFAGRVEALDDKARQALLIAAAHAGTELPVIAAACQRAGTAAGYLADAEACGLVRFGVGQVSFTHPLIRGMVYAGARAAHRRAAHAALAAALRDDDDRRAWHLASAAIEPNEEVAAALERVGRQAMTRRAYAAGAGALERAARLTPGPDATSRRLIVAGQAAAGAGQADRALALLAEAAEVTGDVEQIASAQQLRGRTLIWRGRGAEATPLLVEQASRIAPRSPVLAAVMLSDAANGAVGILSYLEAEQLARRAVGLLGDVGDAAVRGAVLTMRGWTLILRGKAPEARPVLAEAFRLADHVDPLGPDWPWLHIMLRTRIPLGEFEQARAENAELCRRAQDAGAVATLCSARLVVADAAFRLGDWEAADAAARQTLQLAGDVGQRHMAGWALTVRTRILAAQGRPEESHAAAAEALAIAESDRISTGLRFVHGALGFLELGLDRVDAAISELETVERLTEGSGHEEPVIVPCVPDLVEAYARRGRNRDARRVLARLERQAASTASPIAAAAAARCRGMLDDDFEPAFARALACDDRRPMPFERARTLLAFGRRLHRACRRAEARERLRAALEGFERLNADAWARQAEAELRAAGARRRRERDDHALTPQERRVAAAVQRGASNRDIAADLFLSPKTVEFHLHQIYRKLDVHSRTQLVAALADPGRPLKPGNSPGAPGPGRAIRSRGIRPVTEEPR
jgi:DNA-binding CsgD family transcriptional regulator